MIILTDFTNPDKINKIRKPWSSGNPHCLIKTNVTGSNHLFEYIYQLFEYIHSLNFFNQNKHIFNWLRKVRFLLPYNLQYVKLILSVKSSSSPLKVTSPLKFW